MMKTRIVITLVIALVTGTLEAQPASVDQERLLNADADIGNWLTYGEPIRSSVSVRLIRLTITTSTSSVLHGR